MNKNYVLIATVLIVLIATSILPSFAWDSNINQGYTLPTLKELIQSNEKARAVLIMHVLREKGYYAEALDIAKNIYGSTCEITPFRVYNSVRMVHYSQEKDYYCCPAACRSVISVKKSNPPSQDQLASDLGTTVYGTDFSSTIAKVLNKYIASPQGYSLRWHNGNNANMSTLIRSDIDYGYGVLANGISAASVKADSHIPGYPNVKVYHYVAVYGYNIRTFSICDPAYGLSGFNIQSKYNLNFDTFMNFIRDRGIVW